ncbi:MAG: sigma 54-interacting transcriptional regulator [Desulfobacter sp.]|nr:MAG: sigma 54-interacting transcriptional regulator [Desulfobacter sp.]
MEARTVPEAIKKFLFDLNNADFLSVFDEFSDGVIVADRQGTIVYYNDAMSRIDDLDRKEVLLSRVTDVYDLSDEESIIMQCLNKRRPIIDAPNFYRTRMGKFANTVHSVFPVFSMDRLVGVICFVRDYHMLTNTIATLPVPATAFDTGNITFESIIGRDPVFRDAIRSARLASQTPSPVMLFGETGTGKELFARAIHNHGPRGNRKFTPVNCAAIPENLLEGILFGTSKGAFTGSVNKAGLFERTSGGSIFLDEVNSMPVGLQAKILRIVQENKVRRVGALREIKTDLKIISSVNQDPRISISEGTLRSDLFYRLGVVFIHIVPLRRRLGDLEFLVDHFIDKHNTRLMKQVASISDNVMELFRIYNWPGNVRELEHVIEGAMNVVGEGQTIRMTHLQSHFSNWSIQHRSGEPEHSGIPVQNRSFSPPGGPGAAVRDQMPPATLKGVKKVKGEAEKELVTRVLSECGGNIARSARHLGISRQLLYYKIKKYQIDRSRF